MGAAPPFASGKHVEALRVVRAVIHNPLLQKLAVFLVFLIAFHVAYRYGMAFSQAIAAPFWFPVSVLLCALLLTQPRSWPLLIAATLPIRLFSEVSASLPLWFRIATFAIDSAAVVVTALALRRFLKNPLRFHTASEYALYVLFAVLLVPAAAAFGGAAARQIFTDDYWLTWWQWFLGDALAHLIVTPAILYWVLANPWKERAFSNARAVECVALIAGLVVTCYLAFHTEGHLGMSPLYAPIPFLVWAAVRFGMFGATGAMTFMAFMCVDAALSGVGPFAGQSPAATAIALQQCLFERAAPLYLVAVLIEHRRRIEDSLRESVHLFRTVADTAPVMIWLAGIDGSCDFFNKRWLDYTGRASEQERGSGWTEGVHPDDVTQTRNAVERAFDRRVPFDIEYRLRDRGGEYRWVHDRGVPRYAPNGDFAGFIGCAVDVTERRAQVNALRASEQRYREVVNIQQDLVCRYLPDTKLTFVNEAYCRYFGKTSEQLIGTSFLDLIPESSREAALTYLAQIVAQPGHRAIEHEVSLPDGNVGWQHWVDYPVLGPDGQIVEFQAIGYDITDRKRADEANRNLAHASRLVTVGALTAMIAHEVNQPLTAIQYNAEAGLGLLASKNPPLDEIREILSDIRRDDQRADAVIKRIRALSRKRDVQLHPIDLNATITDTLRLAAGDAMRRHVRVLSELEPNLPLVSGDLIHLQQVVLNLVMNGMDAMQETAQANRELSVRTMLQPSGNVEVSVADVGHGIPADRLPAIFESFFTTKPTGMGMGLAISRSIVQAHGGRIWAENRPGGGAVFRFALRPVVADSEARSLRAG